MTRPAAHSHETIHGVALALAVVAAMPVLDLVHAGASYVATLLGLVPPVAPGIAIAVRGAIAAVVLCAKLALLVSLVRAPHRLAWMVRSWTVPILLAVLGVAAIPIGIVLSALDAVALHAAQLELVDKGSHPLGDMIAGWVTGHGILSLANALATAAMWAGILLFAYRRSRHADGRLVP